ncbi:MAG: M1 family metallopeptidase [Bacteroidota bacterium]|nr:M1 family metallopeptidase [Bacteroidota bacterium]
MKKIFLVLSLLLIIFNFSSGQNFTHADTLRGSNGPGRAWWNATKYDLHVNFHISDSSISGYNAISYKVTDKHHPEFFQIDLQEPLAIDSVLLETGSINFELNKEKLDYTRQGNAWFIYLNKTQNEISKPDPLIIRKAKNLVSVDSKKQNLTPEISKLIVYYHGRPRIAKKAPWDGGLVWTKDKAGNPWVAVACQGLGASVWYPCKDYQGDEPDSAEMHFTAPSDLVIISNGRLRDKKDNGNGKSVYTWAVVNPINNYDISPYIGKYVHWGEIYKGEKGNLTMDYWVIDSNLTKAKEQFKEAPRMMKAFEYWFGPYPFYEDGYKLVEAPYLGMEHQSAVAYGNGFKNGYRGSDLSGSGWGLKWDFIIVHESGHEWFGNNITSKEIADMWIHEGFTNYSETLFTEYYFGKKAATDYIVGIRKNIRNDKPIIGYYGVNNEGSGDMYYKAANMIHTIRQIINNDEKFRQILRGLNKTFYHQTVTSKQIEDYINKQSGIDFSKVFDQYLRTTKIPELEYKSTNGKLFYRWNNCVSSFKMPVKIYNDNKKLIFIYPTSEFKLAPSGIKKMKIDENFYVYLKEIKD